jgi:hypothetical protein
MKRIKIFSFVVCLLTLFMVTSVFAGEVGEQETTEGISSDMEALAASMMEDVQTTTVTLEGTAWEADVISIPTFVTTTATFTFSDGMLTMSDWIISLSPETYEETEKGGKISFTATLVKKIGTQTIPYEIIGVTNPGKRITGLIHNLTTNLYYVFCGDPLVVSEE